MIPVEAARQIVRVTSGDPNAEIDFASFEFAHALEFGSDITVVVEPTVSGLQLSFRQGNVTAVTASITPASPSPPIRPPDDAALQGGLQEPRPEVRTSTVRGYAASDLLAR